MTIRFLLLVNKQGQTRLATYNEIVPLEERRQIEGEIVRKCLTRSLKPVKTAAASGKLMLTVACAP